MLFISPKYYQIFRDIQILVLFSFRLFPLSAIPEFNGKAD